MLSRTELFPVTEVVAHRRPSLISEQLAVQGRISLSEVLSALSCALDLTEGAGMAGDEWDRGLCVLDDHRSEYAPVSRTAGRGYPPAGRPHGASVEARGN